MQALGLTQAAMREGRERLAYCIAENSSTFAMLTATKVAQRCFLKTSSVVRVAQDLGFSGYRKFQAVLQDHFSRSIARNKSLEQMKLSFPAATTLK